MIAYCGIDCAKCPAYRLPRLGEKLHMKGFFQWMLRRGIERARHGRSQKLDARSQNAEVKGQEPSAKATEEAGYIICDGCTAIDARCLKPCLACPVRCCAMETGITNCAHCPKFPCGQLESAWQTSVFKGQQQRLEKLRAKLGSPTK